MYCKKCGTESEGVLVYCKKCGALLADSDDFDDPLVEFEQKVDNLFEEFELRRRQYTKVRNSQSGSDFDYYDASDYQPPAPLSSVSSKTDMFSRVKDRMTQSDSTYGKEKSNRQTVVFDWNAVPEYRRNSDSTEAPQENSDISPPAEGLGDSIEPDLLDDSLEELVRMNEEEALDGFDNNPDAVDPVEDSLIEAASNDEPVHDLSQLDDMIVIDEVDTLDDSEEESIVEASENKTVSETEQSVDGKENTETEPEVAISQESQETSSLIEEPSKDSKTKESVEDSSYASTAEELIARRQEEKRKQEEGKPLNFFNFETKLSEEADSDEGAEEASPSDASMKADVADEDDENAELKADKDSSSSTEADLENKTSESAADEQTDKTKKKKGKGKFIALGLLVIAVAIGGLYVFLFSPQAQYNKAVRDGDALLTADNFEEAVTTYKNAIEMLPEKTAAMVGLSKAYIQLERLEEAVTTLEAAIALEPENAQLCKSAARIYSSMDDIESATKLLEKAYELDKDEATKMELDLLVEGKVSTSEKPGTYENPISIELSAGEKSEAIYYTVDGTDPTAGSTPYEEPIQLNNGENTIKAVASVGGQLGQIYSFKYTLKLPAFQVANKSQLKETVDVGGKSFNISLAIPKATGDTINADKVNSVLDEDLKKINEIYNEVSQKDYSIMNEWKLSSLNVYYRVYEYKDMYCLVVAQQLKYQRKGGSEEFHVYYYDGSTGQLVDAAEYAEKCGFTKQTVLEKYTSLNSSANAPDDINTLQFYVDEKGNIYFLSYKAN